MAIVYLCVCVCVCVCVYVCVCVCTYVSIIAHRWIMLISGLGMDCCVGMLYRLWSNQYVRTGVCVYVCMCMHVVTFPARPDWRKYYRRQMNNALFQVWEWTVVWACYIGCEVTNMLERVYVCMCACVCTWLHSQLDPTDVSIIAGRWIMLYFRVWEWCIARAC